MAKRQRQLLLDIVVLSLFGILALPRWSTLLEDRVNLRLAQSLPSWSHPLGTDHLGRDLLVRLSNAIGNAVIPLWLTTVAGAFLGAALAMILVTASRSKVGYASMQSLKFVASSLGAVPLTIATFALAVLFEEANLKAVLMALGMIVLLQTYLQLLNHVQESLGLGFWTAHEAMGGNLFDRIWRYGVRSAWANELALNLGLKLRAAVIVEATLSYLGFGIQEPVASFGNILSAHFAESLQGKWWVMAVTLLALMVTAAAPQAVIRLVATTLTQRRRVPEAPHAPWAKIMVSGLQKQAPTSHI
jgi:peptide/nickel transport system permease protein